MHSMLGKSSNVRSIPSVYLRQYADVFGGWTHADKIGAVKEDGHCANQYLCEGVYQEAVHFNFVK